MTRTEYRPGALGRLIERVLVAWPEHERYLEQRFAKTDAGDLAFCEDIASRIELIVAPDPDAAARHYRWTCAMLLDEEYHFRRTGAYRHSSFDIVRALVYDNSDFMRRYTDGLLLSQVLWANHARALATYGHAFLGGLTGSDEVLEVGPGHGLLLGLAAERGLRAVGWDVSDESLAATRRALCAIGVPDVALARRDVLTTPADRQFGAVVASELLEHVAEPAAALAQLHRLVRPGGRLFLNIPINSPAPDHINLWRTPDEIRVLAASTGLSIEDTYDYPMTGKTLAQATRGQLTMSCVVICRRLDDAPPRTGHGPTDN